MTTVNTSSETAYLDNNYTWATSSNFDWADGTIGWSILDVVSYTCNINEPISISDVIRASVGKKLVDDFLLSDVHKKSLTYKYSDSLLLSDSVNNIANFSRKFVEDAFSFGDIHSVQFTNVEQDSLFLSDSYCSSFEGKSLVNMYLSENIRASLSQKMFDNLLLSDVYKPTFSKKLYDDLLLSDSYRGSFTSKFPVLFNFTDSISKVCNFRRNFYDDFSLDDSLLGEYRDKHSEHIGFKGFYMRGFDFSVSNLGIKTSDLTIDSFLSSLNTPFAYSPFQEFLVGEYDYQKAIVRTSITTQNSSYNTSINKLNIHVDIPDTDDRGSSSIPASNTFVSFNKTYYTKPEVHVNINGGVSGVVMIPHITEITTAGFYIELRNLSNTLVAGHISWTAKGY